MGLFTGGLIVAKDYADGMILLITDHIDFKGNIAAHKRSGSDILI